MNTPDKPDNRFRVGLSFGALVLFTMANVFLLIFVVPKFGQIFADALPGKPLPSATTFILAERLGIALLNVTCLFACGYLVRYRIRRSLLLINLAMLWNFVQVGITILALFMPMVGITTGISDAVQG